MKGHDKDRVVLLHAASFLCLLWALTGVYVESCREILSFLSRQQTSSGTIQETVQLVSVIVEVTKSDNP